VTRTLGDVALDLAAVKAVKEHVEALWAGLRDEAAALLEPGDKKAAKLPDGTTAASVLMTDPKESSGWQVVDESAFLAWVKEHRPTAVIEQVRVSDRRSILDGIATSGELPDGVDSWSKRLPPHVTVSQTPAQRAAVIHAWQTGALALPETVREIETGYDAAVAEAEERVR
jgi:hypothetical protein